MIILKVNMKKLVNIVVDFVKREWFLLVALVAIFIIVMIYAALHKQAI
jgi:hypothetical protein